jgi:hypothetical protein
MATIAAPQPYQDPGGIPFLSRALATLVLILSAVLPLTADPLHHSRTGDIPELGNAVLVP